MTEKAFKILGIIFIVSFFLFLNIILKDSSIKQPKPYRRQWHQQHPS